MKTVQLASSVNPAAMQRQAQYNFEESSATSSGAAILGLPVEDTISSGGSAVAGEGSDLVYMGTTFKKAVQGVGKFFNAALEFFRDSGSEESDVSEFEEFDVEESLPVKTESSQQQLQLLVAEPEEDQKQEVTNKIQVPVPADLMHRVMANVDLKKLGKLNGDIGVLYLDKIIESYTLFMQGRDLRVRGNPTEEQKVIFKEERAVRYAADVLSGLLRKAARRIKKEKVD